MSFERTHIIKPTVSELVDEFCDLGSDDQARFFRLVATQFQTWGAYQRDHQMLCLGRRLLVNEDDRPGLEWLRSLHECSGGK